MDGITASKTLTFKISTINRVEMYLKEKGKDVKDFPEVVDHFINKGMDVEDR